MKWENDANVAEQENIPNFSKLDDIMPGLRLLELICDDVLVDMIVGYTKLNSHREKADISFEVTRLFLSMLLHSRCNKFPYRTMYWQTTSNTFV